VQSSVESALYSFSSHTFTNCGKTGYSGPTLAECKSSYDVSWEDDTDFFDVPSNAGIQLWTVPETATYRVEVWGAQGAFIPSGHSNGQVVQGGGGKGARMRGDFNLTAGDKIKILVGQMGRGGYAAGGGGGGTFVVDKTTGNPLIIAAGGNGAGYHDFTTNGPDGLTTYDDSRAGDGGRGGEYTGNSSTENGRAGGGGGMYGDGSIVKNDDYIPFYYLIGKSFINGGIGGEQHNFRSEPDA
jgi:hypothetical protein